MIDLGTLGGTTVRPCDQRRGPGGRPASSGAGSLTRSSGPPPPACSDLGTLGGTYSSASAINEQGRWSARAPPRAGSPMRSVDRADGMVDLGTLGGTSVPRPPSTMPGRLSARARPPSGVPTRSCGRRRRHGRSRGPRRQRRLSSPRPASTMPARSSAPATLGGFTHAVIWRPGRTWRSILARPTASGFRQRRLDAAARCQSGGHGHRRSRRQWPRRPRHQFRSRHRRLGVDEPHHLAFHPCRRAQVTWSPAISMTTGTTRSSRLPRLRAVALERRRVDAISTPSTRPISPWVASTAAGGGPDCSISRASASTSSPTTAPGGR